ncbi:MAG: enoyl-CoA hydratase [bacterium]|nr:enoyl-CoA hydratase [bacterium]
MSDSPPQVIELSREDGVATLTFHRPESLNSLTPELFGELAERFEEVAANAEDRVMVLTGSGKAFCAGADLRGSPGSADKLRQSRVGLTQWLRTTVYAALALNRISKPTIAAVNGIAAGGGCNLALGCDIVFAGESASFSEIFVKRGLGIDYGGTWLLPRLIGLQRAKDLAFRGDVIDAKTALEYGLVLEVVPDRDLQSRVSEYARELAKRPPVALSAIKSSLNRATSCDFETALEIEISHQAHCMGTKDFREAVAAFFQKREGRYVGE